MNGTVVSRNVEEGQTVVASFQTPPCLSSRPGPDPHAGHCQRQRDPISAESPKANRQTFVDAYPREFFHGIVTQVRNAPISIQNVVTYDVIISVEKPRTQTETRDDRQHLDRHGCNDDALRAPNAALRFRMPGVPVDRKTPQLWILDAAGRV